MTHRSIKSSEVHVRTKPALRLCQRAFQKVVCDFLKRKNIPQVTEHGLRSNGAGALTSKVFYAWRRLAHLRGCFLYMAEGEAVALIPPRCIGPGSGSSPEDIKAWNIRVPINHRLLASVGPVVCEAYWDPMDHDLTVADVLYYNKEFVWETHGFSERYQLLHTIVSEVIQSTGDYSDCTVSLPPYETLTAAGNWGDDDTYCVVFQPEDCGSRRFRYTSGNSAKPHHDRPPRNNDRPRRDQDRPTRKQLEIQSDEEEEPEDLLTLLQKPLASTSKKPETKPTPTIKLIQNDPNGISLDMISDFHSKLPAPTDTVTKLVLKNNPIVKSEENTIECILELDTKNPLPDVYKVRSGSKDHGIAAVRSLALSLEIRGLLRAGKGSIPVAVSWYEPFKKWEVVKVLSA